MNLRRQNIERSRKAGIPVGAEPEKPIGMKAYRKKVKQSAASAKAVRKKRGNRVWNGGRVNPR